MGKGDIKTSKGKRFAGSYGKSRQKATGNPNPKRMAALKAKNAPKEVAETETAPAPAKKPAAKKPAAKKAAATKKPAAKKAAAAKKED
jgi:ribosomal small subunit protein bTHX